MLQAKFEKGLDPNNTMEAMNRACQLIEELGAGEVVGGCVDVYPVKKEPVTVGYDVDKINALLGIKATEEEMCRYWRHGGSCSGQSDKDVYLCQPGDRISFVWLIWQKKWQDFTDMTRSQPHCQRERLHREMFLMRQQSRIFSVTVVEQFGFSEGMTYSFESPKVFDKLLIPADGKLRQAIEISNPLGVDYSMMCTSPLNGMLSSLSTNYNHRNKDVRLYEVANVYLPKALPLTELPDERMQLCLGMYGEGDFFDMKGCVEEMIDKLGIRQVVTYVPADDRPYLHPGRHADVVINDEIVGYLGEIHPEVADNYNLGTKTYVAVMDVQNCLPNMLTLM